MKKFQTIDKQIYILINNHKLEIDDSNEQLARRELMNYGYHEIVNGYQSAFMDDEQKFLPGTRFEDLSKLFRFDVQLRTAIRMSTEAFELSFKQAVSYAWCEVYGVKQEEYLEKTHFRQGATNQYKSTDRDWIFKQMKKVIKNKPKYELVEHHKNNGNIPPWIILKHLTFGDAKQFFTLISDSSIKDRVVHLMVGSEFIEVHGIESAKSFLNDLISLSHQYRNRGSHASRIYSYHPTERNIGIKNYALLFPETAHSNDFFESTHYNKGIHALITGYGHLNNREPYSFLSQGIVELFHVAFDTRDGSISAENERIVLHVLDAMKMPYFEERSADATTPTLKIGKFE